MKLRAFRATKTPLLQTNGPPNNQNTPATQAKKFTLRVQFLGGGAGHILTQRFWKCQNMFLDNNFIKTQDTQMDPIRVLLSQTPFGG